MKKILGALFLLVAVLSAVPVVAQPKPEAPAQPGTGEVIVTRLGAEIPEQPELEPAWGSFIKRAWPHWRQHYWIDRGPWPGANQGFIYRREQPKEAGAQTAPVPPEGITPISPEGKVQEPLIPQPAPLPSRQTPNTYVVRKGDSLWFIAGKVYGDSLKWPKIFRANRGKIKNPDRIYPGQVLDIPPLD